jgi:squalene synthase HpnC
VLQQARAENFPVATHLLPRRARAHLLAIYGFARLTDDIGDEAEGDRLELLDWLEDELHRAADGRATHLILQALTPTLRELDLPLDPFLDLIEANRQDQKVTRYATYQDLLDYCRLSANPVGRLVLLVLGVSTPERLAWSDDVCSGLQIVEHLQDVGEDARAGRIYLPLEDLARFGCAEDDLLAPRATPALRRTVAYEAGRARELLGSGVPLAHSLPVRARLAVTGFAGGGLAALDSVRAAGYDVLATSCRARPARVAQRFAATVARSLRSAPAASGPIGPAGASS